MRLDLAPIQVAHCLYSVIWDTCRQVGRRCYQVEPGCRYALNFPCHVTKSMWECGLYFVKKIFFPPLKENLFLWGRFCLNSVNVDHRFSFVEWKSALSMPSKPIWAFYLLLGFCKYLQLTLNGYCNFFTLSVG